MKLFNILLLLMAMIAAVSCGPTDNRLSFDKATEYNDYIVDIIDPITEIYNLTFATQKGDKYCLAQCDSLILKSEETIALLNGIQPYEDDSSFAMAAKEYCKYMVQIGKEDLPVFINLLKIVEAGGLDDTITLNKNAVVLDKGYETRFEKFEAAQKVLAIKFNYKIKSEDDEIISPYKN